MVIKANETTSDATLTPNSENVNYPATNILDSRRTRLFKTVAATTTATIVFDAGAAVTVDSISIDNHNISSGVTTFKIQGNATDAWGGPSVDETLVWAAGIVTKSFTGGSFRYWRLHIIDAGNTDTFISLGRVMLTNEFTMPDISPSVGHSRNSHSIKSISVNGSAYQDSRYFGSLISVRFPKISHAEKANMISQLEIIDIGQPMFVTFDETELDLGTIYCTIDGTGFNFNLLINSDFYESNISLLEAK